MVESGQAIEVKIIGSSQFGGRRDSEFMQVCRRKAAAINLQSPGAVTLAGYMANAAIVNELHQATLYVAPSTWGEPFGLAAAEAMAAGTAVIVSDRGALPEVVGEAGLCVPRNNPVALSQAIAHLIANPDLRAALAKRARQRVLEQFQWSQVAAQLTTCLSAVVANTQPQVQSE